MKKRKERKQKKKNDKMIESLFDKIKGSSHVEKRRGDGAEVLTHSILAWREEGKRQNIHKQLPTQSRRENWKKVDWEETENQNILMAENSCASFWR